MRIPELKPKSADFKSEAHLDQDAQKCGVPNCPHAGDFKAPKSRDLAEYYYFCLKHVSEYNDSWNFFEGMSQKDIEDHIHNQMTWDRPTWASSMAGINADGLRARVHEGIRMGGAYTSGRFNSFDSEDKEDAPAPMPTPEVEAMTTLGLKPPVDWQEIKEQYRSLVKQHHPDVNPNTEDNSDADMIKNINIAYSILKIAYSKFEKLAPR